MGKIIKIIMRVIRSFLLLVVLVIATTAIYSQGQYTWKIWQSHSVSLWEAIRMQWDIAYPVIIPCVIIIVVVIILECVIEWIDDKEKSYTIRLLEVIARKVGADVADIDGGDKKNV
jgi:hypothetical protein